MDERQRSDLGQLLRTWVDHHPRADDATIGYLGRTYSPRDILDEVEHDAAFGEDFGQFLYETSRRLDTSVEAVIQRAIRAHDTSLQ